MHHQPHNANSDAAQELSDLYKKYRIMEGDRRAYAEESQAEIRRQQAQMRKLKEENDKMQKEMELRTKVTPRRASTAGSSREMGLQQQLELIKQKADTQKKVNDDLDRQIKQLQSQAEVERMKTGGVGAQVDNDKMLERQIRTLENRLNKAVVKFNEAIAHNKTLREEIDALRKERLLFDNVYKRLEKEVHERKRDMANIIEISNSAYEVRDQAHGELQALKQQNEREKANHKHEIADLDRIIDQDRKTREFMKMKAETEDTNQEALDDETPKDGIDWKKKLTKSAWGLATKAVLLQSATSKFQTYEEIFRAIQERTGQKDVAEMVRHFITVEQKNFSLFNLVNEQSNEIEKLESQISDLHRELKKFEGQGQTSDAAKKKIEQDLQDKLLKLQIKSKTYEERYSENRAKIDELGAVIERMFESAGCEKTMDDAAMTGSGVNEANIMRYLGMIEQKASEKLYALQMREKELKMKQDSVSSNDTVVQTMLDKMESTKRSSRDSVVKINLPSLRDDFSSGEDDDDELGDRPMSRQELQERMQRDAAAKQALTGKRNSRSPTRTRALSSLSNMSLPDTRSPTAKR
eukprot:GILJ01004437.1.p1 GENE.GILJ01004437.1~~GILJ01004437.1.p1  ORF type:complete len:581 (-),score=146.53 GILJ01004437.1:80-1822(-)